MENEDKLAWDPMTASLLAPLAASDRPVFRNRNGDVFEGPLPLPCYSRYCFSWCHWGHLLCLGNLLRGKTSASTSLALTSTGRIHLWISKQGMRRECTLDLV